MDAQRRAVHKLADCKAIFKLRLALPSTLQKAHDPGDRFARGDMHLAADQERALSVFGPSGGNDRDRGHLPGAIRIERAKLHAGDLRSSVPSHPPDQLGGIDANGIGDIEEFQKLERPFSCFKLPHKRV